MSTHTDEPKTFPHCILSKFSNRKDAIMVLYEKSPTFREICADYEEMNRWLEENCLSEKKSFEMYHHASELLKELEEELLDCLEGNYAQIAKEANSRMS